MRKLTFKQRRFVELYPKYLSCSQTGAELGYSDSYCRQILTKPHVQDAMGAALKARTERTGVDADLLLHHLSDMMHADIGDILSEDGSYLPIKEWPKIWRQMLSGLDIKELFEQDGEKLKKVGETVKIKFVDRLRTIELIGRHVNIKAWEQQQINLNIQQTIVQRLTAGRERMLLLPGELTDAKSSQPGPKETPALPPRARPPRDR